MKKTRMEFSTMEELYEEGATFLYETDFGVIGEMMEEETFETLISQSKYIAKEKCIHHVYANLPTGKLYVANKGTTFHERDAKLMPLQQAREKAAAMSKFGKYHWMVD